MPSSCWAAQEWPKSLPHVPALSTRHINEKTASVSLNVQLSGLHCITSYLPATARPAAASLSPYTFTGLNKAWTWNSFRATHTSVAGVADCLQEYISYIFSERRGIFSVTSNQELMITADLSDRQHSVSWPCCVTALSQGEHCHLLNQQNCFTQSFCGRLFFWGSLVQLSFSCRQRTQSWKHYEL